MIGYRRQPWKYHHVGGAIDYLGPSVYTLSCVPHATHRIWLLSVKFFFYSPSLSFFPKDRLYCFPISVMTSFNKGSRPSCARDRFNVGTLILYLFHSTLLFFPFPFFVYVILLRCLRCCSNLFWLRVPAMLRCPLGSRASQYRLHFLFSCPPPVSAAAVPSYVLRLSPVPPLPGVPREPLAIPSGRYWLSSPTPRSWSSIPQGATVCMCVWSPYC